MPSKQHVFFHGAESRKPPPRSEAVHRQAVHRRPPAEAEDGPPDPLIEWIFRQGGLSAGMYRGKSLMRRLPACLRLLRAATPEEARIRLERTPSMIPVAVQSLLLGVSDFRRDERVFSLLEGRVVPALRALDRPLRIWSAACSDGRELYSMAILLDGDGARHADELLGTDIREDAIETARLGRYPTDVLSRLAPDAIERCFVRDGRLWRAAERLRGKTRWRVSNILSETASGPWDIILWRNLAIYLNLSIAEEVWLRLYKELSYGGYLVTGKAERPPAALPLERIGSCVYRKPAHLCQASER